MKDNNSLAHTTWNCKYHIVFAPKYRRKVFFGEKRLEISAILRSLCEWKEVKIIEAEVCPITCICSSRYPRKSASADLWGISKERAAC